MGSTRPPSALRVAPISLLQPLSASGLLVVALLAVIYLNERFDPAEWLGVGILLAGVILLGLSARGPHLPSNGIETSRYLSFFAVVAALLVAVSIAAAAMPRRSELMLGILSGLLFGTGYLNTKALAFAVQDRNPALTIVAACLMTLGLLGGLVALQLGLRRPGFDRDRGQPGHESGARCGGRPGVSGRELSAGDDALHGSRRRFVRDPLGNSAARAGRRGRRPRPCAKETVWPAESKPLSF